MGFIFLLHDELPMSFEPADFAVPDRFSQTVEQRKQDQDTFYYFAYGSCMCPLDLARTIGEDAHRLVIGRGILKGHKLAFNRAYPKRQGCGVLDVVPDQDCCVEGVLYKLPWSVSDRLDVREEIPTNGYRHETVQIECGGQLYSNVRIYVVVDKEPEEIPPDDRYFYLVMRGAMTAKLSSEYSWELFQHMKRLQRGEAA